MKARFLSSGAFVIFATAVIGGAAQANSPVADAVMKGDHAALVRLLQQKADVNAPQVDGATALHWAVYRQDLDAADRLLRAGAKVDAANREGAAPLAMASQHGNAPMIERLIKAGADPKQRGPNGETMLMYAAHNGNPAAIRTLLAAGIDVNAKERLRDTTALMWAAEQRHPEAVKLLLAAKADYSAKSGPAGLPRNYFAAKVNVENVDLNRRRRAAAAAAGRTYQEQLDWEQTQGLVVVERRGVVNLSPPGAQTAAPSADAPPAPAPDDDPVIVAGLVGTGGGGLTALVFAAREGDLESARALLDAGADVNQQTEYGWTPLLTAVNNRNYQLATLLVERGADVNIANKGGWTPVYLATDNRNIEGGDYPVPRPDMDHLELIELLLQKGANPNARVRENTLTRTIFTMQWFFEAGATAFVRASQSSDTALMKLLLEYGADPTMTTDLGDTALTACAGIGWVEGVTYERSKEENVEAIRMLLDLGLDPNHANNEGRTPLMGAALKGRNDVVRLLVERGARLETRDRGSRDTEDQGSIAAGARFQALDYAEGLVRAGVQSAIARPDTSQLIRELMIERGLPVPPPNRDINSICVVSICAPQP
jgi:ankyrin repeat protein